MQYSVSVIIPTKNRKSDLEKCLDAVYCQTCVPQEAIVVEGGAQENKQYFEKKYKGLKYLQFSGSTGLTQSKNYGLKQSKGDVLIFLDDDLVIEKDFISAILSLFKEKSSENVGGISGNITNQNNEKEKGLYRIIKMIFLMPMFGDGTFRISGMPTFVYGDLNVRKVEFIAGGVTAYKRKVFDEFMFDEKLTGYCYGEDADFSYRVSRKHDNYYTPFAKAVHKPSSEARSRGIKSLLSNISAMIYRNKKNLGIKGVFFSVIVATGMMAESVYLKMRSYLCLPKSSRY
ncbi:MAG: glycosyltransferase [Candidatus Margulisiibacteriota bacterium]